MMQTFVLGVASFFIYVLFYLWVAFSKLKCGLSVCFFSVHFGFINGNGKAILVQCFVVLNLCCAFGTFVGAVFGSSAALQRGATFLRAFVENLSIRTWFFCGGCLCWCLCGCTKSAQFSSAFQRRAAFLRCLVKNLTTRTWIGHCVCVCVCCKCMYVL